MKIGIRKSSRFLDSFEPRKPTLEREPISQGSNKLATVLEKFESYLNWTYLPRYLPRGDGLASSFIHGANDITEILNPHEINLFIQATSVFENSKMPFQRKPYNDNSPGFFLSRLIQNSFKAGYNNFRLDLDKRLEGQLFRGMTPSYLRGTQRKKLKIILEGKMHTAGNASRYCEIRTTTTGSMFGRNSRNSHFYVENADHLFAEGAEKCTFYVDGKISDGKLGYMARMCTFQTSTEETLETLLEHMDTTQPHKKKDKFGNRIIFIRNGKEEVVKNYGDWY